MFNNDQNHELADDEDQYFDITDICTIPICDEVLNGIIIIFKVIESIKDLI